MTSSINFKDTLLERANLSPIPGEPTFKTLHKLWNDIKSNEKAVYSTLGGGVHGHISLEITDAQYALISLTSFAYPTYPDPIIIPNGTTAHTNSNMQIAHTKTVCLFREVTGIEQDLVKQIFATVEKAYLTDIHNRTKNSINDTVSDVLTHLQDNYIWLIPHKLL